VLLFHTRVGTYTVLVAISKAQLNTVVEKQENIGREKRTYGSFRDTLRGFIIGINDIQMAVKV
jgi:hypothetical protein